MEELERADIVVIFYTTAARVSKFIREKEFPVSLDRSDAGACSVIWVPLERKDLDGAHPVEKRLRQLQCATRDACPVFDFDREAKGWLEVEHSIRKGVEKRRATVR